MEKKLICALFLFAAWVVFFEISRFFVIWHELSHFMVGRLLNGVCSLSIYMGGGQVSCRFRNLTYDQYLLYALAGIIGELSFALILLLMPYTSSLGGYWVWRIAFNHFVDAYRTDLMDTHLYFLLSPAWKYFFLLDGLLILALSAYVFLSFWRQLPE